MIRGPRIYAKSKTPTKTNPTIATGIRMVKNRPTFHLIDFACTLIKLSSVATYIVLFQEI
jgi:hypothetical protein